MPRYRSTTSGVVINVPEEKAKNLVGYQPVEDAKPQKAPAKKSAPSKSSK